MRHTQMATESAGLSAKPRILVVGDPHHDEAAPVAVVQGDVEVVHVATPLDALAELAHGKFAGMFAQSGHLNEIAELGRMRQAERILEGMPDGVVLLDGENRIVWANRQVRNWSGREDVTGANFFSVLQSPEILGPDFCPFHTALATGKQSSSTLRSDDNRYFRVHAAPVRDEQEATKYLIVTIREVTAEIQQQQKLEAIHKAGTDLANLTPDELLLMSVEERIELLKSNILHYTQDLLHYDVVEIRLLDWETGRLEPLLAVGMSPEAAARDLFARAKKNGVTGFVAATGKTYLCEDTRSDPLYLEGAAGAKSSLTVPLMLHDEVIGTFNVESPEPGAFSESDRQFLEIFSRDVAMAINTLELLAAEKAGAAVKSIEAVHSAVALPVDEILNDAVGLLEKYIGHQPEVVEPLQRILRHARDIKRVIHKVGEKMAPVEVHPQGYQVEERPLLRNKRVLVVDADESVRSAAHHLLDRYKCIVETARDGEEACCMARNVEDPGSYDVVIADIRLPDMCGYDLLLRLQEIMGPPPLILMTGFGYDPTHSIPRARQAGLHEGAVLYKPFRLDQLLETVERVLRQPRTIPQSS